MIRHAYVAVLSLLLLTSLCACANLDWMGGQKKSALSGERHLILKDSAGYTMEQDPGTAIIAADVAQLNGQWERSQQGWYESLPMHMMMHNEWHPRVVTSLAIRPAEGFMDTAAPVIAHSTLYTNDHRGGVRAFDLQTASESWSATPFPQVNDDTPGGGLTVDGDRLFATNGHFDVVGLDASTGERRWIYNTGSLLRSAPVVHDRVVIVQGNDNRVFALERETGQLLWAHHGIEGEFEYFGAFPPAIAGDKVLVSYSNGSLYAIHYKTGEVLWASSISLTPLVRYQGGLQSHDNVAPIVIQHQRVFLASSDGMLHTLNVDDGRPLWQQKIPNIQQLWPVGDLLFVVTNDAILALNQHTGMFHWKKPVSGYIGEGPDVPALGLWFANGKLHALWQTGDWVQIDPQQGEMLSRHQWKTPLAWIPGIIADGRLWVVGSNGTIFCSS